MLKVRIIPCLDVKDGRVVKGINFVNLVDAGDPVEAAAAYDKAGADELCFLDITASHENRGIIFDIVQRTAERCFMPLTVGGGVREVEDIRRLLKAGADKVSINTAAVNRREFVREDARSAVPSASSSTRAFHSSAVTWPLSDLSVRCAMFDMRCFLRGGTLHHCIFAVNPSGGSMDHPRRIAAFLRHASACTALAFCAAASAQGNFPARPVTLTVGFAPGGGTDTAARIVAQEALREHRPVGGRREQGRRRRQHRRAAHRASRRPTATRSTSRRWAR